MVKMPQPDKEPAEAPAVKQAAKKVAKKRPAKAPPKVAKKVLNRPKVAGADAPLKDDPPAQKQRPKVSLHSLADEDEKLRVLIYGDPGSGKTTAALRAADHGKVVVIDAERGLKARALRRAGVEVERIEVYDGEISFEALEELFFQLKRRLADGEEIYALVWDSMTMTLPWLVEAAVAEGVARARKNNKARADTDVYVEDYGTMTEQVKRLLTRRFMDLDLHIIVTCLAKREKDDNGQVRITPDVTPALGQTLAGAMDMVLAMRAELQADGSVHRDAISAPMERYQAKDRFGILPSVLVDPGFDRILAYSEEAISADDDPLQGGAHLDLREVDSDDSEDEDE